MSSHIGQQDGHTPAVASPHAGRRPYVPRHLLSPEQREKRRESVRRSMRKLLSTPEGRAIHAAHARKYRAAHPETEKAHHAINHKIESGKILRPACEHCSAASAQAHHTDYSKPEMVVWLCKLCHEAEHHRAA